MITMFSSRCCLFCLVTILCICFYVGGNNSHTKKCAETDKQALLKLKDGFINGRYMLSSWTGEDCCKWEGISCDNLTGHVINLDLSNWLRLGGKIDSSVCELKHLTFLDLSKNDLEGEIPKCIGSLGQLIELKLASNQLIGDIPHTLGNLSHLQTLDLGSSSYFVSNDLKWVSHLSNLRYLDLSFHDLSQTVDWLPSISKIPSLSVLHLDECELGQLHPQSIPQINSSTTLKILSLSGNELNSSTLPWLLNFSKVLTDLDLSYNSLQRDILGVFPNMVSFSQLEYLNLSNNELEGSIFNSSSFQLKGLQLDNNKLSGSISDYIQQLCYAQNGLELLDLSENPFKSAPLPDFSCLSSLKTLGLRNTNIVGPLPQPFGHLPRLANLDLGSNLLSGSLLLFEVSELTSLESVDLSNNQLNGTLSSNIWQISSLKTLDLSFNKLNGVINESHLSNLSRLQNLYLDKNSLSFNLSSNWIPPFQLLELHTSLCILGPEFPTWLKHQRKLYVLQISNSGISDSFPKWFWDLSSSLSYLNVSHNKISGALPIPLPSIKSNNWNVWDFSFNNLSGPLPPFPALFALFLSNNMLSGSISSFCGTSPLGLTYLDLSSNLLGGTLSDCWGKFQSLRALNLAKNNLSGRIPKPFGTLLQIESLNLNNNNFSGEIPTLSLRSNLKFIDFGNNNLQGTLPAWLGHNLRQLIVLRLEANKFHGSIPTSLCNLSFLQVLDLSKNNITGKIPQCLGNMIALSNTTFPRRPILYGPIRYTVYDLGEIELFVDQATLVWKGENREYKKILGLMTIVDLSCNHLTGQIPTNITTLVALAGLNLSRNNLTGFIPDNIGHMQMLESLDLSENHLYGRIPASFSNLTFLSYINLSFNNLSGEIPVSTQLQTFDASTYFGNSGLCGPPLPNPCPGDAVSPTRQTDKSRTSEGEDEDEDKFITFGFYITLGIGFCVGFWGVCGTLVIKTSWRHAYFRFFNNMNDCIYGTLVVFWARMKKKFQAQD